MHWKQAFTNPLLKRSITTPIKTNHPVLCIIDDIIVSKTRPWSQIVNPMEATSNYLSHLKRQMDYGHQAIILYDKSQSKIDSVSNIADALPPPLNMDYLVCDSWYSCNKVMDAFICKGFYTIAGLKTDWISYPCGI